MLALFFILNVTVVSYGNANYTRNLNIFSAKRNTHKRYAIRTY